MTLLDPDAGEILDRLSILARKRLEKPDRMHFVHEEDALIQEWIERRRILDPLRFPYLLRLAAVNGALWQAEDEVRRLRALIPTSANITEHLADRAIKLQCLNEERSRLIQFFNAELGRGAVEEKDFPL